MQKKDSLLREVASKNVGKTVHGLSALIGNSEEASINPINVWYVEVTHTRIAQTHRLKFTSNNLIK